LGNIKGRDQIKKYLKKYGSSGVDYFTLKNDGDSAKVRFLHTNDEDLNLALVHETEVEDKKKYVECLEEDCPFCEAYGRPQLKLFLFLYDHDDEKTKVWERGPTMVDFMLGFIDKYGDLNTRDYEVKRHGKPKDPKTTYQLFAEDRGPLMDKKDQEIELPERPKLYGRFLLQMDKDKMLEHLEETTPIERNKDKSKKGPGF
jgi:hypothetical protein